MRHLLFFLALLLPSIAFADKTAYVRTTCANNGDGTASSCAGAPAGVGAYNSCALAVIGELIANANIVTAGFGHLVIDAAGTTADTTQCVIAGFTTDATHMFKIRGDFTGGLWSTSHYRITGDHNNGNIRIQDQYVEIDKIQTQNTGTGSGNNYGIAVLTGEGGLYLKVTNSLLRGSTATGNLAGVWHRPDVAGGTVIVANTIVYGWTGANARCFALNGAANEANGVVIAYNNTCHGSPRGYATHGGGANDAQYLKNNIAQSNSTAGYSLNEGAGHTTSVTANNLSEDTSSPDNTWDSLAVSFVSETGGSEDLHLQSGDTAAKDQGADLSADAQLAFSNDIDAQTRTGTWDIGADEVVSTVTHHSLIIQAGMGDS